MILFIKVQGTVCACNEEEDLELTHSLTHTYTSQKGCLKRHLRMLYGRQYKDAPTYELFYVITAFNRENFAYEMDQFYISRYYELDLTGLRDL